MKLRLSILLGATLLVLGTTAAACSDDEELTLEEYFQQVETLEQEWSVELHAWDSQEHSFETGEEYAELLLDRGSITGDFVEAIDDISPPPEAESAHDEKVEAGNDVVNAVEEAAEQVADADSLEEAVAVGNAAIADTVAIERLRDACQALRDVATANDIDSTLCED